MNNLVTHFNKLFNTFNESNSVFYSYTITQNIIDLMIQDGIMVVNNNENNINIFKSNNIEYITIKEYIIARKNYPNYLEWLNPNDGTISFTTENNYPMYRRCLNDYSNNLYGMPNTHYIIYEFVLQTDGFDKNFIELGVATGGFTEIMSKITKNVYGVDIAKYETNTPNIFIYNMTTDEFHLHHLKNINFDYAFIDADHASNQAIIDFEHIYSKINNNGYIFMHDTYPGTIENLKPTACNDCYLSPIEIKKRYPNLEIISIPANPGLTIIKKT